MMCCDAARDSQLVYVVVLKCEKELYVFTGAILNIPDNVMGLKILKQKCAWGRSFVMIIWKLLSLKMSITLRTRSSGSAFCRNYQRTKGSRS